MRTRSPRPSDPGDRTTLLLGGAAIFADILLFSALGPILPELAARLHFNATAAGLLTAGCPIGEFLCAIPAAMLCRRAGARRAVVTGVCLTGAASIVFGVGRGGFAVLLVARVCQGAGGALTWIGCLTLGAAAMPADRRGEAIGTLLAAAGLGSLCGPLLGGTASALGIAPAFVTFGIAIMCVGVLFVRRVSEKGPREGGGLHIFFVVLRRTEVIRCLAAVFLLASLGGGIMLLAPLNLSQLGVGDAAIAGVLLVAAAGQAILNPVAGRWSDRYGPSLLLRSGLVCGAITLLLVAMTDQQVLASALIIVATCATGLAMVPAIAALSSGAEAAGLASEFGFSMMSLAWAPGFAAGALVTGKVADGRGYPAAFIVTAALCVVGLVGLYSRFQHRPTTQAATAGSA